MTIKILDDQPISLTRDQYDRLQRAWQASQSMTTHPKSFEEYVRARQRQVTDAVDMMRPLFKEWKS
jgi:hypothetical protein